MKKLLLTIALITGLANANTDQVVTSQDGQRPYLIVTADDEGASKRAPGVYVADEKGQWHQVLAGKLLSGRFTHGILSQLQLTQFDQRYESIAVIDGKLTLFSVNTKLGVVESHVVESVKAPGFHDLVFRRTNFCKVWHVGATRPRLPPADMTTSAT